MSAEKKESNVNTKSHSTNEQVLETENAVYDSTSKERNKYL